MNSLHDRVKRRNKTSGYCTQKVRKGFNLWLLDEELENILFFSRNFLEYTFS